VAPVRCYDLVTLGAPAGDKLVRVNMNGG
jgi:hypothetical protein